MALLANAGRDFGSYFRHDMFGELFDAVFVSGELGMITPTPDIFATVLHELGITPEQMAFIHNEGINVRGAEALSIGGHTFTGADDFRTCLSAHRVVPQSGEFGTAKPATAEEFHGCPF